jgi:hypothetical protein
VAVEPSAGSLRLTTRDSLWGRVMNNFVLLAADRAAQLKVVMLSLILATLAGWGYALVVLSDALR